MPEHLFGWLPLDIGGFFDREIDDFPDLDGLVLLPISQAATDAEEKGSAGKTAGRV